MAKLFAAHRPKPAAKVPAKAGRGPAPPKHAAPAAKEKAPDGPKEIGGPDGPEPTRYGDWERKGICVDF